MRLVKYSCGCIGPVPEDTKKATIFQDCRDGSFGIFLDVNQEGKEWQVISKPEAKRVLTVLGGLVVCGHNLQLIKALLH